MIKEIFGQRVGIYDLDTPDEINDQLISLAHNINAESYKLANSHTSKHPHNSGYVDDPLSFIGAHLGILNRTHLYSSFPKEFLPYFVEPTIKKYIDDTKFIDCSLPNIIPYVERCWFTYLSKNDKIQIHNHDKLAIFGIAYYPEDTTDKGNLIFHSQDIDKKIFSKEPNFRKEVVETKKNRLIIFPSHLFHSTEQNKTDDFRISYSMDVMFIGTETFMPPPHLMAKIYESFNEQLNFIGEEF